MTANEFLSQPQPGAVPGPVGGTILVREPPGYLHGIVAARLLLAVANYATAHRLGVAMAAESGFTLFRNPDTVRTPDVAFIRTERLSSRPIDSYPEFAPDLAIEVLSPWDRPERIRSSIRDWLAAGTRLVWVVDPVRGLARVYRVDGSESPLTTGDVVDGEDVLPGLRLAMSAMCG